MKEDERLEQDISDDALRRSLLLLQAVAPANTLVRLRRRIKTLQLGRDLFEKQVFGFWIVLHELLTVAYRFSSRRVGRRSPTTFQQAGRPE